MVTSLPALCIGLLVPLFAWVCIDVSERVAVLDVFVDVCGPAPPRCEGEDGPAPILVSMTNGRFVVGEELHVPVRIATVRGLKRELEGFKQLRPDRQQLILQLDDHVTYEQLVEIVDLAAGLDLHAAAIEISPDGPAFSEKAWGRPSIRAR